MKIIFLLAFVGLGVASCKKKADNRGLSGKYDGTFQRIPGTGSKETAQVSIEFTASAFSGNSDQPKYPAICNGTYNSNGAEINFFNGCGWTADFDGTLILDGKFSYSQQGDSLEIRRSYGGQASDVYKLQKR
jgi:hypothetical protein